MDIRKSGLESNDGKQEKWYVFDDRNLVVAEFYLPKIFSGDFEDFLMSIKKFTPDKVFQEKTS